MSTYREYTDGENAHVQNPTPAIDIAHSVSVNTVPSLQYEYFINEAFQGYRFQGRMSNIRRFFCLFILFDMFFIGFMWFICMMIRGKSIWQALDEQIVHYKIETSLFDIVVLAICRFVLLWFFYGLIQINHWIIVFITTVATCTFSIAKVFYYNWQQTPQPFLEVLSIVSSFILAWGEAWFLDYRVIPQEAYANQFYISSNERSPLIQHFLRGAAAPSRYTGSVENYQSLMNTPDGSLHQFPITNSVTPERIPPYALNQDEVDKYKATAVDIMEESKLLFNADGWVLERENEDNEVAHIKILPSGRKIFKISASFNASPRSMVQILYHEVENIPNWNSALLRAQRVQIFDEYTDILYQISASAAGGFISSRDFVSLRHWAQAGDNTFVVATKGTLFPGIPKNNKYVRGENGVTCLLMEPGDHENHCKMQLIFNTDLKGWIPQAIVDLAIVDTLFDYVKCLKIHVDRRQL